MIKLVVRPSEGPEEIFSVQKQSVIVGRGSNCDIVLIAEGVSRQHLKIEASRTGVCYLTDLGSTNGTIVDGKRIKPNTPVPYAPFHVVSIGSIPSIAIDTGASAEKTLSAYRSVLRNEDKTAEIQLDIPAEKTVVRPRPPKASDIDTSPEGKALMPYVAIVVVVLGLSYYFFMK